MSVTVGIIAEDESDVEVIDVIISKSTAARYSTKSFVGHGCGKIRNKCHEWAENLRERGCRLLILVHDLDAGSLRELRRALANALGDSPLKPCVIIIPVREIEAWLLADPNAIRTALNIRDPIKRIRNPEGLPRPKEYLRDLIYRTSKKKITYLNTIHNAKIARAGQIANFRNCESFKPLQDFIVKNLPPNKGLS
jgi:hypothetical protein